MKIAFAAMARSRIVAVSLVLAALGGCGGGGSGDAGGAPAPQPVAPAVTGQPASQTVREGQSASFSVSASGDAPLAFQWQRGGMDIAGATSTTFTLGTVQRADDGSVWNVKVSNAAGAVVSASATLSVQAVGSISLLAGSADSSNAGRGAADGIGSAARFSTPAGLALDPSGNLYVSDYVNNSIRKISPDGVVSTFAATPGAPPVGGSPWLSLPGGLAFANGLVYVVSDFNSFPHTWSSVYTVTPQGQLARWGAPPQMSSASGGIATDAAGNVYLITDRALKRFTPAGAPQTLDEPGFTQATEGALASDAAGNLYYGFGNSIRKRSVAGVVTTLAGDAVATGSADGPGTQARFNLATPDGSTFAGLAVDSAGNVFVADVFNHTIRKIAADGSVTTVAGKAGVPGIQAGLLPGGLVQPGGLALQGDKTLFVSSGNAVLKIALP